MDRLPRALLGALALLLTSAAPSFAATTMTVNGGTTASVMIGDTLTVGIDGPGGAPAALLVDLAPGPTVVGSQSIDVGFSPAFFLLPLGPLPGSGSAIVPLPVPLLNQVDGLTVYFVAVTQGAGGVLEFSPGAAVTLTDRRVDVAGSPLGQYPFFEFDRTFNAGDTVTLAIDPGRLPAVVGQTADIYVTDAKTKDQWLQNPALVDVTSGGAKTFMFTAGTIQANTVVLDTGSLSADAGLDLGRGYDVVIDLNRNGVFDGLDLIDGYGAEAGFYVVPDVTQPGPLAVTELLYSGGTFLGQNTFYPTNIATMGKLPLVVVSHGNGHNYQWYDHIGNHLASWGFIVMSHQNNTQPGIETASVTTLTNTEYLLANQATIAGGVLNGHIDGSRIMWIGHSRGGEGVVRAYDKIAEGAYVPVNFSISDIKLVSSMAPTNFLSTAGADPHGVNYSLWIAAADNDVNGCAGADQGQPPQIHDRATETRQSISIYGFGHGDFHNSTGSVASGPCLVGKPNGHLIQLGYILPLAKHYLEGSIAAKDFLWRQYERFHPIGAPIANPCVTVNLSYREGSGFGKRVLDDFQTQPLLTVASSGVPVTVTALPAREGVLNDNNGDFTDSLGDVFNGMTWAGLTDTSRGMMLSFDGAADYVLSYALPPGERDLSRYRYLSFRAAQGSRHPLTTFALGDLSFGLMLADAAGHSSTIHIDAYGGGIEEPYQRTGCGAGAGWNNEFETVRIRLADFQTNGTALDLRDIETVEFQFGPSSGSAQGRLGLDDIEFVKD